LKTLLNVALFQAGWLACVLGAAAGRAWLGPIVVALVLVVHLVALHHGDEARLVGWSALMGAVADSLLAASGLVGYAAHPGPSFLAPVWIVAMWANFAITLGHSLSWLAGRPLMAALVGLAGGPLAYAAGARLGAIDVSSGGLVALALVWAVALPSLTELASARRG
jgi:hypothetical protein